MSRWCRGKMIKSGGSGIDSYSTVEKMSIQKSYISCKIRFVNFGGHDFVIPFVSPFVTPFVCGAAAAASPLTTGISTAPPGLSCNLAVNTSTPSSVTSNVCSNCAVLLPSTVTLVQLSGHVLSR